MLHLVRNGIFGFTKSWLRYSSIHLYRFSVYHSLISSKRLLFKSFYVAQPSHTKQPVTLQGVDCDTNLNLNRVLGHSKQLSLQLNGRLRNYESNYLNGLPSDTVEKNPQKRNEAKHNCFDGFWKYLQQIMVSCLCFSL